MIYFILFLYYFLVPVISETLAYVDGVVGNAPSQFLRDLHMKLETNT